MNTSPLNRSVKLCITILILASCVRLSFSYEGYEKDKRYPYNKGVLDWIGSARGIRVDPLYKGNKDEIVSDNKEVSPKNSISGLNLFLPVDREKQIDWVNSVRRGLLNPLPSIEEFVIEEEIIDVEIDSTVIYHNSMHIYWLSCDSCHPAIFPMVSGGTRKLSMLKIFEGEYCGWCHGKVAFSLKKCSRCHLKRRAPKPATIPSSLPRDKYGLIDWVTGTKKKLISPLSSINGLIAKNNNIKLPKIRILHATNLKEKTQAGRLGVGATDVVFPHSFHSKMLGCNICHPKIFPKSRDGITKMNMNMIYEGEYCGRCHGKVAFPIQHCGRCHLKLRG